MMPEEFRDSTVYKLQKVRYNVTAGSPAVTFVLRVICRGGYPETSFQYLSAGRDACALTCSGMVGKREQSYLREEPDK